MTDLTPEEAHVVLARLDRTTAVTFGEGMALAAAVEKLRAIVGRCSRTSEPTGE